MSDRDDRDDDDVALAGEYVLRLLDAEAEAAFAARLDRDPALAAEVRRWEADLALLADELEPVAPPAAVRAAVVAGIAPEGERRRRRGFWPWAGLGGVLAAAAVAVVLILPLPVGWFGPNPDYRTELVSADGGLVIRAGYAEAEGLLHIIREAGGARPGRALQLWLITDGAPAPVSLGVLPEDADVFLTVPPGLGPDLPGGTLAISDEPPGGSPTGLPTGDVLATATWTPV